MQKLRSEYDNISIPDIQSFITYQHIISFLEFGTTHNSKGYYLARENCRYAILFYCNKGRGKIIYEDTTLPFEAGDTVIMPPGTSHILISDKEEPFLAKWINVSGSAVENLLSTYSVFGPTVFKGVDTAGIIQSYHTTLSATMDPWEVISNAILLLTGLVHSCVLPPLQEATPDHSVAEIIKSCIDLHMQDTDLSVTKVSQILKLPLPTVTKAFKKEYGIGPHTYISRQRIQNSKLLLRSTDLSVREIAETMGFSDSNYFFYFFKKSTGMSPAQFRKHHADI